MPNTNVKRPLRACWRLRRWLHVGYGRHAVRRLRHLFLSQTGNLRQFRHRDHSTYLALSELADSSHRLADSHSISRIRPTCESGGAIHDSRMPCASASRSTSCSWSARSSAIPRSDRPDGLSRSTPNPVDYTSADHLPGWKPSGLLTSSEKEELLPGRDMSRITLDDILAVVRR